MRNYPYQILNAVDTASQTGTAFFVGQSVSGSFCSIFADTSATGTVKIQCSNDVPTGSSYTFTPTNWNDIPNANSTITAGVGPAIVLQTMSYQYVRVVYTRDSGGSSTIIVNATVLNVS